MASGQSAIGWRGAVQNNSKIWRASLRSAKKSLWIPL